MSGGRNVFRSHQPGSPIVEGDDMDDFTGEAKATYDREVQRYAEELKARARTRTPAEVVLKADVCAAAEAMKSTNAKDSVRLISDWIKRIGILFVGFAVTQFLKVQAESRISQGSVNWLLADVAIAVALLVGGLALDRTSLRGR